MLIIQGKGILSGVILSVMLLILGIILIIAFFIFHSNSAANNILYFGIVSLGMAIFSIIFLARDNDVTVTHDNLTVRSKTIFQTSETQYSLQSLQRIDIVTIRGGSSLTICYQDGSKKRIKAYLDKPYAFGIELSNFLNVPLYNPVIAYTENDPNHPYPSQKEKEQWLKSGLGPLIIIGVIIVPILVIVLFVINILMHIK